MGIRHPPGAHSWLLEGKEPDMWQFLLAIWQKLLYDGEKIKKGACYYESTKGL